jgi:S-formylglutathione hydrolase FrmB
MRKPLAAAVIAVAVLAVAPIRAQTASAPATQQTTRRSVGGPQFEITFEPSVSSRPFTGRVYVITTKRAHLTPLQTIEWFASEPLFARDVRDWKPGEKLLINSQNCLAYPCEPADLPAHIYRAQAIMGLNNWAQHPIDAPGNGCSEIAVFRHPAARPPTIHLVICRKIPEPAAPQGDGIECVHLKSELLSAFYHHDVFMEAVLALPGTYSDTSDPDRRFPTVYHIPGFDGRIRFANPAPFDSLLAMNGLDAVVVDLCASCPTGHHVFADSANNGPWGKALVTELIPYLESHYRLIPDSGARFLTGHSSGGWSSLWLQVTYPQTFGGVWSTSPDPVDFTSFMQVNIYDPPASIFTAADGSPRMLSRPGFFGQIGWHALSNLEQVMGRGGQLGSFEAVFSPRGPDGKPARLWDRATGAIDPQVACAWRKYDICDLLASHWSKLDPLLKGKLHIYCGDRDDFFLEQPFSKLRDELTKLGSDAHVELINGASHTLPMSVFDMIAADMARQFETYNKRQAG